MVSALTQHIAKGPVDSVTEKALYTLSEDWLLWQAQDFSSLVHTNFYISECKTRGSVLWRLFLVHFTALVSFTSTLMLPNSLFCFWFGGLVSTELHSKKCPICFYIYSFDIIKPLNTWVCVCYNKTHDWWWLTSSFVYFMVPLNIQNLVALIKCSFIHHVFRL